MTGVEAKPLAHSSEIIARYEMLRSAALGELLPPEARSGLFFFLHRGMWGWARALAAGGARQETIPARSPPPAEPFEHRAVIHVLAALAMTINDRRTA
jgi:hypothetical protein